MNQDTNEEDNTHLDADYRAVQRAREANSEKQRPHERRTFDGNSDAPDGGNGTDPRATGAFARRQSGQCTKWKTFDAVKDNNVDTLRQYLEEENRPTAEWMFRDIETGETLLHSALAHRSYQAVDFLMKMRIAAELVSATYDKNVDGQISPLSSLHQATEIGDIELVRLLLAALDNREKRQSLLSLRTMYLPQGRRPRNVTCLHIAAMNGFDSIIEFFVGECGVNVNEANECNDTALMWAALEGRRRTMELLIRLGADVNASNDQGSTALYYAVRNNHSEIVELLLKQRFTNFKAKRSRGLESPLVLAAAMGSENIVDLLLQYGADARVRVHGSETALHYAAAEGHLKVCQLLLQHGAELEAEDDMGETALLEAAKRNQTEVVDYLLSQGANILKLTVDGRSVWTYAMDATNEIMLLFLLQRVSLSSIDDDNRKNSSGYTSQLSLRRSHRIKVPDGIVPVHIAAERGDAKKLRILLSHNMNGLDARGNTFVHAAAIANQSKLLEDSSVVRWAKNANNEGRTPLHYACHLGHKEAVEVLVKITPLDIRSCYGSTVLHEAAKARGNKDRSAVIRCIMKYIRLGRYWNLLDAKDDHGYTALHWAVIGGCKEALRELSSLKLCIKDRDGNTPLHLAAASGDVDLFAELLRLYPRDVCSVSQQDNVTGMTPVRLAIQHSSQAILEQIIRAGADLAAVEPDGKCVIHWIADKITFDESLTETYMQAIRTITDMSVAWWAITRNEQMPHHPSKKHQKMKIAALKNLFGNTVNSDGLTIVQYAASIGCFPLLKYIFNLTGVFKRENPNTYDVTYDVTDFAPHTTAEPNTNHYNHKVHPAGGVSANHEKAVKNNPSDRDYASRIALKSNNTLSILEMVVSNKNAASSAAVLDLCPFKDMAKPYWRWYQRLWVFGFLYHALTVSVVTYHGIQRNHIPNDTKVPEGNCSQPACSSRLMPIGFMVVVFLDAFLVLITPGPLLLLAAKIINVLKLFLRNAFVKTGNRIKSKSRPEWNEIPIDQIIWKVCGSTFALTTMAGLIVSLFGPSFQDYLLSIAVLCGWIYLIYFLTRLQVLYQFSLMLERILHDCIRFFAVFMFILLAFSFAQHIAIIPFEKYAEQYVSETTFITFQWLIGMNSFWEIHVSSDDTLFKRYVFLALLYTAYIGICTVVLMNLLIATMTDSFNGVRNNSAKLWGVDALRQGLKIQRKWICVKLQLKKCCMCDCNVASKVARTFGFTHSSLRYEADQQRWFLEMAEGSKKRGIDDTDPVAVQL